MQKIILLSLMLFAVGCSFSEKNDLKNISEMSCIKDCSECSGCDSGAQCIPREKFLVVAEYNKELEDRLVACGCG